MLIGRSRSRDTTSAIFSAWLNPRSNIRFFESGTGTMKSAFTEGFRASASRIAPLRCRAITGCFFQRKHGSRDRPFVNSAGEGSVKHHFVASIARRRIGSQSGHEHRSAFWAQRRCLCEEWSILPTFRTNDTARDITLAGEAGPTLLGQNY